MAGKSFFVDTTRCTACRGCQVACKNWNQNGASQTRNTGSHQNPPDFDGDTFKLVRFSEVDNEGKVAWYFFADQCRHCLEPPCKDSIAGYVSDAVIQDDATGAIFYTEKTREAPFDEVRQACPYDIPRQAKDGRLVKCTMCIDRVSNGLIPACVKICPTGAMNFGDRDEMLALAKDRQEKLKAKYPKAQLLDADQVRVIYLVVDDPKKYSKTAVAALNPVIDRKSAARRLARPAQGSLKGAARG